MSALAQPVRGQRLGDVDMRRHRQRMDPGIGAAGGVHRHRLAGHCAATASSSACCTDGPWSCRCQPMNGRRQIRAISFQRVTAGSCPPGSESRAAARPAVIGAAARALDHERPERALAAGDGQAVVEHFARRARRRRPTSASSSLIRSPRARTRRRGGREGADLPLDLARRARSSRSAPRPCRPWRRR